MNLCGKEMKVSMQRGEILEIEIGLLSLEIVARVNERGKPYFQMIPSEPVYVVRDGNIECKLMADYYHLYPKSPLSGED